MLALPHMKAPLEIPLMLEPKGLTLYFGGVAVFLAVATALILGFSGGRLVIDTRFVAAILCLNGFLAILLLLAHRDIQSWIATQIAGNPNAVWFFLSLNLLLYLVYTLGTDSLRILPAAEARCVCTAAGRAALNNPQA